MKIKSFHLPIQEELSSIKPIPFGDKKVGDCCCIIYLKEQILHVLNTHTHNFLVMNVLTNPIVAVLLQHILVSSYHIVYLKLTQFYMLIIFSKTTETSTWCPTDPQALEDPPLPSPGSDLGSDTTLPHGGLGSVSRLGLR